MALVMRLKIVSDWHRIRWQPPDKPRAYRCSYCAAEIDEDVFRLMMFSEEGYLAEFCDPCSEKLFKLVQTQ